ncbi:EAL domain-containing protein [Hafnia psychrotolerans]|nr:EAL domain-containing protein [Hafnia psychrotolerans]
MLNLNFHVSCEFRCEPIISFKDELYAVELLTSFFGGYSRGKIEPQSFIASLDPDSSYKLLLGQLTQINKKSDFFRKNNLLCSLNIEQNMARLIMNNNIIRDLLDANDFIRLEISEKTPNIDKRSGSAILHELSNRYPLWLDDYGVDFSNINTLKNIDFEVVKIDKKFFWEYGFSVMWGEIISNVKQYCNSIVVEGVETRSQLKCIKEAGVFGAQGFLFPSVTLKEIDSMATKLITE